MGSSDARHVYCRNPRRPMMEGRGTPLERHLTRRLDRCRELFLTRRGPIGLSGSDGTVEIPSEGITALRDRSSGDSGKPDQSEGPAATDRGRICFSAPNRSWQWAGLGPENERGPLPTQEDRVVLLRRENHPVLQY